MNLFQLQSQCSYRNFYSHGGSIKHITTSQRYYTNNCHSDIVKKPVDPYKLVEADLATLCDDIKLVSGNVCSLSTVCLKNLTIYLVIYLSRFHIEEGSCLTFYF